MAVLVDWSMTVSLQKSHLPILSTRRREPAAEFAADFSKSGDLGHLDKDSYRFLTDRKTDGPREDDHQPLGGSEVHRVCRTTALSPAAKVLRREIPGRYLTGRNCRID